MVTTEAELIERSFVGRLVRGKINDILSSILLQPNAKAYIQLDMTETGYSQRCFRKRNLCVLWRDVVIQVI